MDKATLARIFEPFFTTKKIGFGTGLGLSLAHSMIVQSRGYISAESEVGEGTCFEILLPCADSFQKTGGGLGTEHSTQENSTPTVLLVDDDTAVRRLMHKFLEREGYQLLEAGDGQEAELVAKLYPESIHVLVSDVMMPGMSGLELAARLKPMRPDIKTLFVSGYQHDILELHGLSIEEVNLLPKPFAAADLRRRVQMLMEKDIQSVQ
jgi:CheY-like chemotaxis protein